MIKVDLVEVAPGPRSWIKAVVVCAGLLAPIGCGLPQEGRLAAPALSPDEVARQALAEYDANKDGFLAGDELCPAFKGGMEWLDADKDGKLSADEIAKRLREHQETKIALQTVGCLVTLDGNPLPNATVRFVPEKFQGAAVKEASGVTDAFGTAQLAIAGESYPGANLGFYRIEVSLKDEAGREVLPARYHTKTELGQEVGPRVPTLRGNVKLALSSQ